MTKKTLTPKQTEALDHDNDGKAGGSKPAAVAHVEQPEPQPPQPPPPSDLPTDAAVSEASIQPDPQEYTASINEPGRPAPTVGRVVHFYDNLADGPYAAIVTGLDGDLRHLMVFRRALTMARLDVPHLSDLNGDGPHWVWPNGV